MPIAVLVKALHDFCDFGGIKNVVGPFLREEFGQLHFGNLNQKFSVS